MATESNKKMFHKIFISFNEDDEDTENNKAYSFQDIWNLFYDAEADDSVNSLDNFKTYIKEEADAIKRAQYPEDGHHENTYIQNEPQKKQNKGEKKDKKSPVRKKMSQVAINFFSAQDEYFKKHEANYGEYLAEERDANKINDVNERNIRLDELKEKYKDALIAFKKCKDSYAEFKKYEATINFLDAIPKVVIANILDLKKECEDRNCPEIFQKGFDDLFSKPEFMPTYQNKDGEKEIVNNHHMTIGKDSNVLAHTIHNLNGTDLDLTFTDRNLSVIRCEKNMNKDQVEALAEYCYRNNITINDFGSLKDTMVVDKEGKEIGKIEDEYQKAINANKEDTNIERKIEIEAEDKDFQIDPNDSYFGQFISEEKITRKKKDVNLLGLIKIGEAETPSGLDMDKAKAAILKFVPSPAIVKERNFGETVIKVYNNKEDIAEDCKYNDKGKINRTKKFSIAFSHDEPKASFYMGKEKMTPDMARVALDTFKAQGYKYFTFPPLTDEKGFGKEGHVAFLKASVGTRMVILLKGPDGKGCNISINDMETIMDGVKNDKDFAQNTNTKIEYLMRWHEQLEKYIKTTGKTEELGNMAEKIKQQVNFAYFEKSYKDLIDDEINKGIQGDIASGKEPWDEVDVIASQHAYTQIIKNIQKGHLGGKRYNPMDKDGNRELILKEFNRLRQKQRPVIEQEINKSFASLESGDNKIDDPRAKAVNAVRLAYENNYTSLKDDLEGYGINIGMKKRTAIMRYKPNIKKDNTSTNNYTANINPRFMSR